MRFHIYSMKMRPYWSDADPKEIKDWRPFSDDLHRFLDENELKKIAGVGHSIGATITLHLALQDPDRFHHLVLIDPVIFPPFRIGFWDIIQKLNLGKKVHPWFKGALKRRTVFKNKSEMFNNYRQKPVFSRISDIDLQHYVDSLVRYGESGRVELNYPPAWEAQIYLTGMRNGLDLWKNLSKLTPPLLILRGEHSNTFSTNTFRKIEKKLPFARLITIPNTSHLVPLEKPAEVARHISEFLNE